MTRVLQAEAVISATDKTGGVFERIAGKIQALDRAAKSVSGAAGAIGNIGSRLQAAGGKIEAVGRKLTVMPGLATAVATGVAYHTVHDFELASNKLKAFGDLTDEQLKQARDTARKVGKDYSFGPVGVLQGMVEEVKAGFEGRHLEAIQKPLLDFATLAEIDVPKAAELAIFSLAGFGKMYDQTGRMLEASLLNKNLREMVDLFAILNKVAPGNIKDISETFKYVAATAKNMKLTPEQTGALTAVLAQSGIIGPEAGVALRSMLVRFIKPPRTALASLSAAGMRMEDYVVKNPALLKPDSMLSAIEQQTGTLSEMERTGLRAKLGDLSGLIGDEFEKGLIAAIQSVGKGGLMDADVAGNLATRIVGTAIEKIDVMKFLKDVFEKVANPAAVMSLFMDQRQGNRLANLDSARVTHMLAEMEKELTSARERGVSVSQEMAGTINSGLIGAENKLRGSWQNLMVAMAESGVMDSAAKAMDALANGLRALAETNPKIVEFATYAALAAAALGPLVLVVGKLATAGGTLARLLAWVVPGAAAVGGGSSGAMALALGPAAAAGLWANSRLHGASGKAPYDLDYTLGSTGRFSRSPFSMPPSGLTPAQSFLFHDNPGGVSMVPVKPVELSGQIGIDNKVDVKFDTNLFRAEVLSVVRGELGNVKLNGGMFVPGTSGSTGKAMPEATPSGGGGW